MTGLSMGAAHAIADAFPWVRYHTVVDIGAAEGGIIVRRLGRCWASGESAPTIAPLVHVLRVDGRVPTAGTSRAPRARAW